MVKKYEGQINAYGLKIGIVSTRYNELITHKLEEGAIEAFLKHGAEEDRIDLIRVSGAFELPYIVNKMLKEGKYDIIICLGAIIRGETPHFDYIAAEVAKNIAKLSAEADTPVVFGVVIADTQEQALERAGSIRGNRGWEAAITGMEMANLHKSLLKEWAK